MSKVIESIQLSYQSTPRLQDHIEIGEGVREVEVPQLVSLFRGEWWTKHRTEADVRRMLDHTDLTFTARVRATRELVGFARALTDRVYKALLFDLIVTPALRHSGIGRLLVESALEHPKLAETRHLELYCRPEMVPYYERWGFATGLEVQLMRLDRRST